MEEMLNFRSQSGQALLVVVITMIVALTAGLSLASRTITNLKISKQNEDSQRAFQAASAGIEKYIQSPDSANNTGQFTGASFNTNVQNLSGASIVLNNGENVDQDRGMDVWLSNYPDYSNGMGLNASTNISVCWEQPEPGASCALGSKKNAVPAVEILLLTGGASSPTLKKYAYDPCGRQTNFTVPLTLSAAVQEQIHASSNSNIKSNKQAVFQKILSNAKNFIKGLSKTQVFAQSAVPTLVSTTVSGISESTAIIGATISSAGSPSTILERGTCWGIVSDPTTNCAAEGGNGTGAFTQTRTGLTANTNYYVRAYAKNATGTGYSQSVLIKTAPLPPTFINPSGSVNVTAGVQNIRWSAPPGAVKYHFRINDKGTTLGDADDAWDKSPSCLTRTTQGDICRGDYTSNTYSYEFLDGHIYQIWVHADNGENGISNSSIINVTANPAGPSPSPVTTYVGTEINCKYGSPSINLTNTNPGLLMKVIPLFNSTKIKVTSSNPLVPFPSQGKVIESTGSSGDTKRKIIYYESYPQIPNEIFSYGILSQ